MLSPTNDPTRPVRRFGARAAHPVGSLDGMQRMFVLSTVAVLVRAWHEPDPTNSGGDEAGVRVEIRLLGDTGRRGSPSAAQALVVDQPVWRADLFDLVEGPPANFARAHFHPRFEGVEPCPI